MHLLIIDRLHCTITQPLDLYSKTKSSLLTHGHTCGPICKVTIQNLHRLLFGRVSRAQSRHTMRVYQSLKMEGMLSQACFQSPCHLALAAGV